MVKMNNYEKKCMNGVGELLHHHLVFFIRKLNKMKSNEAIGRYSSGASTSNVADNRFKKRVSSVTLVLCTLFIHIPKKTDFYKVSNTIYSNF